MARLTAAASRSGEPTTRMRWLLWHPTASRIRRIDGSPAPEFLVRSPASRVALDSSRHRPKPRILYSARAGVECNYLCSRCSGWNRSQIGDSANVLHHAPDARVAIEQVVEEGNQWRALAAGRHVGRAKI